MVGVDEGGASTRYPLFSSFPTPFLASPILFNVSTTHSHTSRLSKFAIHINEPRFFLYFL